MFYNAHAHCFTLDHVPENFAKPLPVTTSMIKAVAGNKTALETLLAVIAPADKEKRDRLFRMGMVAGNKSQREIIDAHFAEYPEGTRMVCLTMDMDYMSAGEAANTYNQQLVELAMLKMDPAYAHRIYPFICIDPRRAPEEGDAHGEQLVDLVKRFVNFNFRYQGIKLYPALGFWPFDYRLTDLYRFAIENELPVMTHCAEGPVYYRGGKEKAWGRHPVTRNRLKELKNSHFSANFTNPLNYECLMNRELLQQYFDQAGLDREAPDLSQLKICIAHFGGSVQWDEYLRRKAGGEGPDSGAQPGESLDVSRWNSKKKQFTWFTMICDLIRKYPHVYTDISSTLAHNGFFDLLIDTLKNDPKIRERTLFGTDFFVVGNKATEKEFYLDLKKRLEEAGLFDQIARVNVERYLNNRITPFVPIKKD